MRNKLLYLIFGLSLLLGACSKEDVVTPNEGNNPIEITFSVSSFTKGADKMRGIVNDQGSLLERKVENLYLLLFKNDGTNPKRYYINAGTFADGTWSTVDNKITLNLTQKQAGERQVYIIANVDNGMKTKLDAVNSVADLTKTIYMTTVQPWSPNIKSSFLMSGNKSHNFNTNYQLKTVPLIRAVAKIELTIKLSSKFYSMKVDDIRYRFVDFDKKTYVIKPNTKPDDLVSSSNSVFPNIADWNKWGASLNMTPIPDYGFGYKEQGDNLVELKVITYINERDNKGAKIELALYPEDTGILPPPEFGPEFYAIPFPDKIERNHWYKYDIEI